MNKLIHSSDLSIQRLDLGWGELRALAIFQGALRWRQGDAIMQEFKSLGLAALQKALAAKPWMGKASAALESGDIEALEVCRQGGWGPSLGDSKEWFGRAMRERNGHSIAWLLNCFPLDAYLSDLFKSPQQGSQAQWSSRAMSAAEDFAMGVSDPSHWVAACSGSRASGAYFEQTLRENPRWSAAVGSAAEQWQSLRALLIPISSKSPDTDQAAKACAKHCAKRAKEILAAHPGSDAEWRKDVLRAAMGLMDDGRPLSRIDDLMPSLAEEELSMRKASVLLPKASRSNSLCARARRLAQMGKELAPGALLASLSDRPLPIGMAALMGASMDNFEWALSRGWIGPIAVSVEQKCENPDFIAFDEAKVTKEQGRHIDMEQRWTKCREIIEASSLPSVDKERLLGRVLARDPSRWREGGPKVFELVRQKPASPLAFLLGASGSVAVNAREALEKKAQLLSAKGYQMRAAISSDDPLGDDAKSVAKKLPWALRMVDREEIAAAASQAPSVRRPMAL